MASAINMASNGSSGWVVWLEINQVVLFTLSLAFVYTFAIRMFSQKRLSTFFENKLKVRKRKKTKQMFYCSCRMHQFILFPPQKSTFNKREKKKKEKETVYSPYNEIIFSSLSFFLFHSNKNFKKIKNKIKGSKP